MKQSPDCFFSEHVDFLNSGGVIENCTDNFLISFLFSRDEPICVYVDDNLFYPIHEQNQLRWGDHKTLWVPPKASFIDDVPVGFNSLYGKSIGLLKTVSSSLWDDVKLIVCSSSQEKLKIPLSPSKPFTLDGSSEYDLLIDFLSNNQYENVDLVVRPFHFSIRGAIIDFYPPHI